MIPDSFKIQFSALFILFLGWLLSNVASLFSSHRSSKADDAEANNQEATTHSGLLSRFGDIERLYRDSFLLLAVVLILNSLMLGNKTSTDAFSLIGLFSILLGSGSELFGLKLVSKGFWILFLISLFSIFVTGLATPGYVFVPVSIPPSSGSPTAFDPNNFNINDFLPRNG
ncbi:hypothetical protein CONCODRAFT_12635 [Conidiobolus coronatus NRRL 28638]|uniref:Transmembrane protein n=1 Tax=Conidiobolus coronatus (strain ATCC 28846 / CBS 209.66 / NRRL 28638) TaxID=796925 RepID=A0A137NSM7_CONC2|nr:hypothetical protein CONCODRAFT_12635 [Conidiobolus coronatus NRRL 28638]|eukprot:KXN65706.1 hypothetical protein CONCODRAFT_12635 [Conidiobolus coronatus NRRL 28638]